MYQEYYQGMSEILKERKQKTWEGDKRQVITELAGWIKTNKDLIQLLLPMVERNVLVSPTISSLAHRILTKLETENAEHEQDIAYVSAIKYLHAGSDNGAGEPRQQTKDPLTLSTRTEPQDLGAEARDDRDRSENQSGKNDTGFAVSL